MMRVVLEVTMRTLRSVLIVGLFGLAAVAPALRAQQGRAGGASSQIQYATGTQDKNPDGSLLPTRPFTSLFTQDAYTQYEILDPGSESFRITYEFESSRAGATEMTNATRGGSEGSDVEVYDPRTGDPVKFAYEPQPGSTTDHQIRATLPRPIPQGGIGRLLVYKTYKDDRTYMMDGKNIVWVRSLSGYRLGVVLPKGYAFTSASVAAQLSTLADGRLKIAFANPSGLGNPVTIHAHPTTAAFVEIPYTDMFFDDMKTLYDLGAPETGTFSVQQTYSDPRKGKTATLDSLGYLALKAPKVVDLDTGDALAITTSGKSSVVTLGVPITGDRQSAHLRLTGTITDGSYTLVGDDLVFTRTLHGLRNTIELPAGWEISGCSQSGAIGTNNGRAFVALVNLNAENTYRVTIHARKAR
jgi:hypothetical protein